MTALKSIPFLCSWLKTLRFCGPPETLNILKYGESYAVCLGLYFNFRVISQQSMLRSYNQE